MAFMLTVFLSCSILSIHSEAVSSQSPETLRLSSSFKRERSISASDRQVYTVRLDSGSAVVAAVDEDGVDLAIDVCAPGGKVVATFERPFIDHGTKSIDFTAERSGDYRLVVRCRDDKATPAKYVLRVDQVLGPEDNAKRLAKAKYRTPLLYELWEQSLRDPQATARFVHDHPAPIVEPSGRPSTSRVTYFCLGDRDTVRAFVTGGPDFVAGQQMFRLGGTNLFVLVEDLPSDARITYGYYLREEHRVGPHGQVELDENRDSGGGLLELPDAPSQAYATPRAGTPSGSRTAETLHSAALNEDRRLTVYTPPHYSASTPCNLLVVFDGGIYGGADDPSLIAVPTPTILDNLIAEDKIRPTVAVFVWTMGVRERDLNGSKPFADFVATELIPWARSKFKIASGPEAVTLAGSSSGGFCAAYCALNHPEAIGNVLSQSGAFWITSDWRSVRPPYPHDTGMLIEGYRSQDRLPIRFYLEVGRYDLGASLLGANRELRDVLLSKGYEVDYHEFDGGHDYACWRGSLADGLISLLGGRR